MRLQGTSILVIGLVLGCSGEQGATGERGEQGTPGERGEKGDKGDNGLPAPTPIDAGQRPPQPVWRDATGKFIPMSNVSFRRLPLGPGGTVQPSDFEYFVQDAAGLTWTVYDDIFELGIAIRALDLYYKSMDCTGPAYTFVVPAKWTLLDRSSLGTPKTVYYPKGVASEQFKPSSVRRDNDNSTCSTSNLNFTSKFFAVASAIELPTIAPSNPYSPPYVLTFE